MKIIAPFLNAFLEDILPETHRIPLTSNLTIHDAVYCVTLSGSRGPKRGFRPNSDIDLTLLVDPQPLAQAINKNVLLEEVIDVTLRSWKSPIELDTAAAFAKSDCTMQCLFCKSYAELRCGLEKPDCLGLYKTQKGFHGIVPDMGLRIENIYPIITIWLREKQVGTLTSSVAQEV